MNTAIKVSREELARIVRSYNGNHIFGVQFIKKDGSLRRMAARKHVTKGVTGAGLKYNPTNYGLISVFDVKADGFRMVNENTLLAASIDGFKYEVL